MLKSSTTGPPVPLGPGKGGRDGGCVDLSGRRHEKIGLEASESRPRLKKGKGQSVRAAARRPNAAGIYRSGARSRYQGRHHANDPTPRAHAPRVVHPASCAHAHAHSAKEPTKPGRRTPHKGDTARIYAAIPTRQQALPTSANASLETRPRKEPRPTPTRGAGPGHCSPGRSREGTQCRRAHRRRLAEGGGRGETRGRGPSACTPPRRGHTALAGSAMRDVAAHSAQPRHGTGGPSPETRRARPRKACMQGSGPKRAATRRANAPVPPPAGRASARPSSSPRRRRRLQSVRRAVHAVPPPAPARPSTLSTAPPPPRLARRAARRAPRRRPRRRPAAPNHRRRRRRPPAAPPLGPVTHEHRLGHELSVSPAMRRGVANLALGPPGSKAPGPASTGRGR